MSRAALDLEASEHYLLAGNDGVAAATYDVDLARQAGADVAEEHFRQRFGRHDGHFGTKHRRGEALLEVYECCDRSLDWKAVAGALHERIPRRLGTPQHLVEVEPIRDVEFCW